MHISLLHRHMTLSVSLPLQITNLTSLNSLAQAEIALVLAVSFRPGGPQFELFETDESDIVHVHDFLFPMPRLDSKGFKILVR